mmetsp:Transcript_123514/g.395076  ORF Transcript_123514/g.395076 Transcript_123514/m.395076 type:complete len:309 (+) Transcript_123514:1436-2362(+)
MQRQARSGTPWRCWASSPGPGRAEGCPRPPAVQQGPGPEPHAGKTAPTRPVPTCPSDSRQHLAPRNHPGGLQHTTRTHLHLLLLLLLQLLLLLLRLRSDPACQQRQHWEVQPPLRPRPRPLRHRRCRCRSLALPLPPPPPWRPPPLLRARWLQLQATRPPMANLGSGPSATALPSQPQPPLLLPRPRPVRVADRGPHRCRRQSRRRRRPNWRPSSRARGRLRTKGLGSRHALQLPLLLPLPLSPRKGRRLPWQHWGHGRLPARRQRCRPMRRWRRRPRRGKRAAAARRSRWRAARYRRPAPTAPRIGP